MKVASLFSGCGGIDVGLSRAGHEIVLHCEADAHAQAVLRMHFPRAMLVRTVQELTQLPREIDLVTAGFPCIDVSVAGKKLGIFGPHTGQWTHVTRLLRTAIVHGRPIPWLLLENVPGILQNWSKDGIGAEVICRELEGLGYNWAYRVIDASTTGVPMRRRRWFLLASIVGDPRDLLLSVGILDCLGGCQPEPQANSSEAGAEATDPALPCVCCYAENPTELDFVVDPSRATPMTPGLVPTFTSGNILSFTACLVEQEAMGRISIESAEALQGFPAGWTDFSKSVLMPSSRSMSAASVNKARATMLGNAVAVDVAHFIGIQLAFPYKNKYCPHHQSDLPMKLHRTSWPGAAWFIKGLGRHQVEEMSEFPLKQPLVPLAQILTISEVAEPQLKNDVCGYLNRLRSSGFDPSHLLECVRRCGLTSALPVPVPDEYKNKLLRVGPLVLTKVKGFPHWPGEVFDFSKHVQRPTMLAKMVPCHLIEEWKTSVNQSKVLVVAFGDNTFAWFKMEELQAFTGISDYPNPSAFLNKRPGLREALEEAEGALALQKWQEAGSSGNGEGPPLTEFTRRRYELSSRMQQLARGANNAPRCERCAACQTSKHSCIRNRVWSAAACGHVGASLSLLGEAAKGKVVEVWWRNDGKWYPAKVMAFNPFLYSHSIFYFDDKKVEDLELWRPNEFVRVAEANDDDAFEFAVTGQTKDGFKDCPSPVIAGQIEESKEEDGGAAEGSHKGKRRRGQPNRFGFAPEDQTYFNSVGSGLARTGSLSAGSPFLPPALANASNQSSPDVQYEKKRSDRVNANKAFLKKLNIQP